MAVVWEFDHPSGAHVQVCDDCYSGISAEELQRRLRLISETILRVDRNIQRREASARGAVPTSDGQSAGLQERSRGRA